MSFGNVLIGIKWNSGTYRIQFQRNLNVCDSDAGNLPFHEVCITNPYLDKFSVINYDQVIRLLKNEDDKKAVDEQKDECDFYLFHRFEL